MSLWAGWSIQLIYKILYIIEYKIFYRSIIFTSIEMSVFFSCRSMLVLLYQISHCSPTNSPKQMQLVRSYFTFQASFCIVHSCRLACSVWTTRSENIKQLINFKELDNKSMPALGHKVAQITWSSISVRKRLHDMNLMPHRTSSS